MVGSGGLEHIGHQLCRDWGAGFVFLVLSSVREVGEDDGDAAGGGGFAGVRYNEQFHQAIVDVVRTSRLKDKHCVVISAAFRTENLTV